VRPAPQLSTQRPDGRRAGPRRRRCRRRRSGRVGLQVAARARAVGLPRPARHRAAARWRTPARGAGAAAGAAVVGSVAQVAAHARALHRPPGHDTTQAPADAHLPAAAHALPQAPQWFAIGLQVAALARAVGLPAPQETTHTPRCTPGPRRRRCRTCRSGSRSVWVSRHTPRSWSARDARHHAGPATHTWPAAQALPHMPQLARSVCVSRHDAAQLVVPIAQETTQAPREHTCPRRRPYRRRRSGVVGLEVAADARCSW
jgi:hypothetical protein